MRFCRRDAKGLRLTHAEDVQKYIDGVLDGSIVTGRLERLAVWRHVDDIEKWKNDPSYPFEFSEAIADKSIRFSSMCRQFEGEWANHPLQLRRDQKFVVWCMMGWRRKEDKLRRFRQVQWEMARKGGKSTVTAYLACLLLFCDTPIEEGAQIYVAATKQKQAKIVWNHALKMIEKSPDLRKLCTITPSQNFIQYDAKNSRFEPLAADKTPDGFNPHCIIKDEEHAWRQEHRSQAETLASGFGARMQPITITITTYGDTDSLIWKENHDYAVRCLESVIDGNIVDDSWFAFICALDYRTADSQPVPCFRCKGENCPWCGGAGELPIDDPFDEKVWIKANPGIGPGKGYTPKLHIMQGDALLAKQRPDKLSEFLQKNCNIIVASGFRLLTPDSWAKSAGELSLLSTVTGHAAIDLGRTNDFASIAGVWSFTETDDDGENFVRYEALTKSWTVEDRPKELQLSMIDTWIGNGDIIASHGDAVDFLDVYDTCKEWHSEYSIRTWAYDKTYAHQLAQMLTADGLEMFVFGQSHKFYTAPIKELLRCVGKTRTVNGVEVPLFKHNGNPCLAWQAGNLCVDKNTRGEMMPDKSQDINKIDAMVAVLMALSECLYHQDDGVWNYQPGSLAL
jgi:phage terminase large subunit-like protein